MNEKESLWKDFEQRATVTFPEIKGATVSVLEGIAKDAGFTYKEIGKLQTIFEEKKAQGMAFYSILFYSILFYSLRLLFYSTPFIPSRWCNSRYSRPFNRYYYFIDSGQYRRTIISSSSPPPLITTDDAPVNWERKTVNELKAELSQRGLDVKGRKDALVKRLKMDDSKRRKQEEGKTQYVSSKKRYHQLSMN